MKEIKIGLLGLGNIGTGTYKVLEMNRDQIEASVGTKVNIVKILEKYIDRERDIDVPREKFVAKAEDIFDRLNDYLSPSYESTSVSKEGTTWLATGTKRIDNYINNNIYIELNKTSDGYVMKISHFFY